jgi:hypothetical protein
MSLSAVCPPAGCGNEQAVPSGWLWEGYCRSTSPAVPPTSARSTLTRACSPRGAPHPRFQRWVDVSLHALSGGADLQVALFVLAGLCAAALLAGYHTRAATLLSFVLLVSLHAQRLGVFPLVSVAALVPFVQADVWDRLPLSFRGAGRRLDAALPNTGWRSPRVFGRLRPLTSAVPAAFVLAVVVTNAVALGFVPAPAGTPDRIEDPTWGMFAPFPPQDDGWHVAPVWLDSGDRIDAIRQALLRWDRPADLRAVASTGPSPEPVSTWERSSVRAGSGTEPPAGPHKI